MTYYIIISFWAEIDGIPWEHRIQQYTLEKKKKRKQTFTGQTYKRRQIGGANNTPLIHLLWLSIFNICTGSVIN